MKFKVVLDGGGKVLVDADNFGEARAFVLFYKGPSGHREVVAGFRTEAVLCILREDSGPGFEAS